MKRNPRLLIYAALSLLVIAICNKERVHSQSILDRTVTVNLIDATPIEMLGFLSRNYNIYTGIETITYEKDGAEKEYLPINIKCLRCSVGDVLNKFATIDNRYTWSYTDDTIIVLPKDTNNRIVNTHVRDIQIKQNDIDEITKHLFTVPEIVEAISKRSLTPLTFMSSGVIGAKSDEVEKVWLSQRSTTLIKVLNEIIKKRALKTGQSISLEENLASSL